MKKVMCFFLIILPLAGFNQSLEFELIELKESKQILEIELDSIERRITELEKEIERIEEENNDLATSDIISTSMITLRAWMRELPKPGAHVIDSIQKGVEVDVLAIENDYYKIKYKNQIGFINNIFLYDPDLIKMAEEIERNEFGVGRSIRYEALSEKYGFTNARKILNKNIWIGMTDEMAKESIGSPNEINRTIDSWGTHEQWVYGKYSETKYLYFDNGILTTIQE